MAGSYREIDYRLRPAKTAERHMLCDAFRRLRFGSIEGYQYIGLGSVYFSDFILFHRSLGIDRMVSIEKEAHDKPRFDDNLPFANIEMRYGMSHDELPHIDLSLRTIAWLDYDGMLSKEILDDVRYFASNTVSGSVLTVTVQCNPEAPKIDDKLAITKRLRESLGSNRVPLEIDDDALGGWGTGELYRRIIVNEIQEVLTSRNGLRPRLQHIQYGQIFYFFYKDNARMLTTGGVFYDESQKTIFDSCGFSELSFVRTDDKPLIIRVPKLTFREIRKLDCQLPRQTRT